MDAGRKIGFSENGQPVPIADFDFNAVDPAAVIEDLRLENENLRRDLAYAKSKAPELAELIFCVLLWPPYGAEELKRRAWLLGFLMGKTCFTSQADLARFLGITPAAVTQQLNALCSQFPLLARLRAL